MIIEFPHLKDESKELRNHIDHVVEDNAKFHAELSYGLIRGKLDTTSLNDLAKTYDSFVTWVLITRQLKKEIGNPGVVQAILDMLWKAIRKHPDLFKSKCDNCAVRKEGRCLSHEV